MENTTPTIEALQTKIVPLALNAAFISAMNGGTFTLENTQSNTHRTFRVRNRDGKAIRVGLLNGPDNTANYVDFATITIAEGVVSITADTEAVPNCPKCGKPMRLREQRKGAKAGRKFWGCSQFPNCMCIVKYEPHAIGAELRETYSRMLVAVIGGETWGGKIRVLSSGACAICGRKLTTPESIDRGIGPECWGKVGGI